MKSKFINELVTKYELESAKNEAAMQTLLSTIVSLYYVADIQLVILKAYLRKKTNEDITDKETENYALLSKQTFFGKYRFIPIDNLSVQDRSRIYQDFRKFKDIYNTGFFEKSQIANIPEMVERMEEFDISIFTNYNYCINDIQLMSELKTLGIKEFIDNELLEIIKTKKLNLSK